MPGMYFHSYFFLSLAKQARDRTSEAIAAEPEAWSGDAIASIIIAAAATEAFINELSESMAMRRNSTLQDSHPLSPALDSFTSVLREVEDSRGSVKLKYLMAFQTLTGHACDKGGNPFQDFSTLVSLRNDLMHLKPRDTFIEKPGTPFAIEHPSYVKELQKSGHARRPKDGVNMSWLSTLQTAETAKWACDTAENIILSVLQCIPDTEPEALDPSFPLKSLFRPSRVNAMSG